jgi:hypothetical protein
MVTNMASLFFNRSAFNARIDRWDVGKVTTLERMFTFARAFNQPVHMWFCKQRSWPWEHDARSARHRKTNSNKKRQGSIGE